jgi:hypothetical protein
MKRVLVCKKYLLLFIIINCSIIAQTNADHNNKLKQGDSMPRQEYEKNYPQQSIVQKTNQDQSVFPIIKDDFMVNLAEGTGGCDQWYIRSAVDGYGNRVCVWRDTRNDKREIYAQFFDANGNRIGNNIKLYTFDMYGNNWPFVTANLQGDFVITYLVNYNTLVAQKFNNTGQQIGGNVYVTLNGGYNISLPCAAVNDDGSYMVMCSSEPGSWIYTLYARIVDKFGILLPDELIINSPSSSASTMSNGRHIATDEHGNYYIAWNEYKEQTSKIYLQVVDRNGLKIGNSLLVSEASDTSYNVYPEIVSAAGGNFMIAWHTNESWPEIEKIKGRIYNSQTGFLTDVMVLDDTASYYTGNIISSDKQNTFYLLGNWNAQNKIIKINLSGEITGSGSLNDLIIPGTDYYSIFDITDVVNNKFYISLAKSYKGEYDVFSKTYDSLITPISQLEKINDDSISSVQREPLVCFNNFGESIVLWRDERDGWSKLYAQTYDADFNPVNGNIRVDDTLDEQWFLHNKIVKARSDGSFVIAFTGSENYSYGDIIYLQAIDRNGNKIGNNVIARENSYSYPYQLAMNIDSTDEALLVFYDQYGASCRRYDKDLIAVSTEKYFLKYTSPFLFTPISVSVDANLNLFAAWKEYDYNISETGYYVYGQFFNKNGSKVSDKKIIDSTNNYIEILQCVNDGTEDFMLAYKSNSGFNFKRYYMRGNSISFSNRFDSYGYYPSHQNIVEFKNRKAFVTFNIYDNVKAFYFNDNKRIDSIYDIHSYPYINDYYDDYNGVNSAGIYNDNLFFAFESNRHGDSGSDIWANVRKINNVNFNHEYFFPKAYNDVLYDNYPNPFNSKTKINYEILTPHKVKLTVYDILGREVKVLVDEEQEKGIYEVVFDADNLASGVYLLRLEAFDTVVKKIMLLK